MVVLSTALKFKEQKNAGFIRNIRCSKRLKNGSIKNKNAALNMLEF